MQKSFGLSNDIEILLCIKNYRYSIYIRKVSYWCRLSIFLIQLKLFYGLLGQSNMHSRLVNLHPLFLFWKHCLLVCDPEKNVPKYGLQKARYKNKKKEEVAWPLLFLNNNDPVFSTQIFLTHILDLAFKVPDPKQISAWPDKLK